MVSYFGKISRVVVIVREIRSVVVNVVCTFQRGLVLLRIQRCSFFLRGFQLLRLGGVVFRIVFFQMISGAVVGVESCKE